MRGLHLKAATENDYELMYRIKEASIKPYVEQIWGWDESFQKRFLRENTPYPEVAFIIYENETAGFLQTKEGEYDIFIAGLFIISTFQQTGIGTYLLREISGCRKTVSLEVLKINTIAFNWYKKMNFVAWKEDDLKYFMRHLPVDI